MKVMSIIAIILFTWLIVNRYSQYAMSSNYLGKTYTFTDKVVKRTKGNIILQMIVCVYGFAYAVSGTVYFFRNKRVVPTNSDQLAKLFDLREHGAISHEEYEREKYKIIM